MEHDGADRKHRKRKKHRHHHKRRRSSSRGDRRRSSTAPAAESTSKLLFDFIPYYGKGDFSTDASVRDMLQAASESDLCTVEEEGGNTLLLWAAMYGASELVSAILERQCADVNAVNTAGAAALHYACYGDTLDEESAVALLDAGAKPDAIERTHGCTPLHYAAGSGALSLCRTLIAAGARVEACDFYNYTAVDYAVQGSRQDCAAYLGQCLAAVNGAASTGAASANAAAALPAYRRRDSSVEMTDALAAAATTATAGAAAGASAVSNSQYTLKSSAADDDEFSSEPAAAVAAGVPVVNGVAVAAGTVGKANYWIRHKDTTSGQAYHLNEATGESLWEKDLQQQAKGLVAAAPSAASNTAASTAGADNSAAAATTPATLTTAAAAAVTESSVLHWLKQQTYRARVVALLAKQAPLRLMQLDELMRSSVGAEESLLKNLAAEYGVTEDKEIASLNSDAETGFKRRVSLLHSSSSSASSGSSTAGAAAVTMKPRSDSTGGSAAAQAPAVPAAAVAAVTLPASGSSSRRTTAVNKLSVVATAVKVATVLSAQASTLDLKLRAARIAAQLTEAQRAYDEAAAAAAHSHSESTAALAARAAAAAEQSDQCVAQAVQARSAAAAARDAAAVLKQQLATESSEHAAEGAALSAAAAALEQELAERVAETAAFAATM
jgi:trimeric autotransporter adhesin